MEGLLSTPEYKAPTVETTYTVGNELTGLLDKGGSYLDAARTQGLQYVASRNLVNTSLGAEATEKARIEAALPIAQQDAAYKQSQITQGQQGDIQSQLYGIQGGISSALSSQEASQTSALSAQQAGENLTAMAKQAGYDSVLEAEKAGYITDQMILAAGFDSTQSFQDYQEASDLAAQASEYDIALAEKQGEISGELIGVEYTLKMEQDAQNAGFADAAAADKAGYDWALQDKADAAEMERLQTENDVKLQLADMQLSDNAMTAISGVIDTANQTFMDGMLAIMTNVDLTTEAKTEAIAHLQAQYEASITSVASIYGVTIDWGTIGDEETPPDEEKTPEEIWNDIDTDEAYKTLTVTEKYQKYLEYVSGMNNAAAYQSWTPPGL